MIGCYEIVDKIDGLMFNYIIFKEDDGMLVGEMCFLEKFELLLCIGFYVVFENEVVIVGLGSGCGDMLCLINEDNEEWLGFFGFQLCKKLN